MVSEEIDCPTPTSVNRWYRDGYMARLNGKKLSTNPKAQNNRWNMKAQRWEHGWFNADTVIHKMTEWDREQEIIDGLDAALS